MNPGNDHLWLLTFKKETSRHYLLSDGIKQYYLFLKTKKNKIKTNQISGSH